jgi:KUP system potassium uptake protein
MDDEKQGEGSEGSITGQPGDQQPGTIDRTTLAITLAALGVVFGDIGTSPLYAVRSVSTAPTP